MMSSISKTCNQVEGVLSVAESERFIDAAESSGFQATTSKGPAFGEVAISSAGGSHTQKLARCGIMTFLELCLTSSP